MSMWKRAMDYLGLGPDDPYDDYDVAPEPERPMRGARHQPMHDDYDHVPVNDGRGSAGMGQPAGRQSRGYSQHDYEPAAPAPRPMQTRPTFPSSAPDVAVRRPVPAPDESTVQPRPINPRATPAVTRLAPAPSSADPHTVRPRRFDAAQEVADKFKEGLPVIMNLEATDRDVARRLIDFASGLCYGLDGSMEKVGTGVYLLKPLPRQPGFDDQAYGG